MSKDAAGGGQKHPHPVRGAKVGGLDTVAGAPKVGEVERDQRVCVSYSSPDDQRYVSVSGRAQLVRDPAKVKELWGPAYKAWFPKGPDDPELALLRVEP